MSAPPYMKLYVMDYIGDTLELSTEEHGAYLLLLMAMWRAGGKLPRDARRLAQISRCDEASWARIESTLMPYFLIKGGSISQRRLTKEIRRYSRKIEAAKIAGNASAAQRGNENNDIGVQNEPTDFQQNDQQIPQRPGITYNSELISTTVTGSGSQESSNPTALHPSFWPTDVD